MGSRSNLEPSAATKRPFAKNSLIDHSSEIVKVKEQVKYNFQNNHLQEAQANLLRSGRFSDLQITCQGRTWNVHRCIVTLRCSLVAEEIKRVRQDGGTHFSFMQDAPRISMDDDDPDAIDSMLYYPYTQQMDYNRRATYKSVEEDVQHLLMAIGLGDKYDMPLFASVACTELEARINSSDGVVLPQIVRAMHLETASGSLVAMPSVVARETAARFCKDDLFDNIMEAIAIEFPKFGFDVMSLATKALITNIVKIGEQEEDETEDKEDEEDEEDGPARQQQQTRYDMRTKATPKKVVELANRGIGSVDLS